MSSFLKTIKRSNEVLGINHRNAVYLRQFNPTRAKRIADNKILTKQILTRHEIPTAEIYKVIRNRKQLAAIHWEDMPKSFALKPNIGTGGSGILIFFGKRKHTLEWIQPDGSTMNVGQIENHIGKILDGQFSMGNRRDSAIIEERIVNHPMLKPYSFKGIPDIRVIVFNNVPIIAELRLPTYESGGKANLHAGGIGVGIDVATGITTTSIHRRGSSVLSDIYDVIETTLDRSMLPLRGIQIPHWKEILHIAITCQKVTGLGFLGADIALDKNKGPIVLELNARSGLAVQIANVAGMRARLERVKGLKIKSVDHGIRVAQNLFGGEVEDELEAISGREIIGLVEKVSFHQHYSDEKKPQKSEAVKIKGKVTIDTGVLRSRISTTMADQIGFQNVLTYFNSLNIPSSFSDKEDARSYLESHKDEISQHSDLVGAIVVTEDGTPSIRPVIPVTLDISDQTITADMIVSTRKDIPYSAIMGKRDLKPFLIDASKTFSLH